MIGKLQTNKVKFAVRLFDYIHSVDSEKLAKKIADEQNKINKNKKKFVIINNKFSFVKLIFEDYKNEFIFLEKVFKFQFIDKNNTLNKALFYLNKNKNKCLIVLDNKMKLFGTLTDGDVRRAILNGAEFDDKIFKFVIIHCKFHV